MRISDWSSDVFSSDLIWRDIKDHALLRFQVGEAARHYNVLQKLSYAVVLFILLPLMVLTGLTMSPGMNAAWPWLLDLFGGRQSARSIRSEEHTSELQSLMRISYAVFCLTQKK